MISQNKSQHEPYKVYKSDISYFSGKLEAYLRYKEIDHESIDVDRNLMDRIADSTGIRKMPAVETADGLWLIDTTPMIQWFESKYPEKSIMPRDPALRFISLLIEDYADEWLWRPAMWWRWMPRASSWALGWRIARQFAPRVVARPFGWYFGRRQRREWLWGDGMTKHNSDSVRDMLFHEFEFLESLLEQQPYLLGSHPSVADFGYFASMFRHFGNDVESAEVMRRRAPNTYEWLARLWNAKSSKLPERQKWIWPDEDLWLPLYKRICEDYLPYLHQNSIAYKKGLKYFDYTGKNHQFKHSKTTIYRVWCRQNLQNTFAELSNSDKQRIEHLLAGAGGLAALHMDGIIDSGLNSQFRLPIVPAEHAHLRQNLRQRLFGQARN